MKDCEKCKKYKEIIDELIKLQKMNIKFTINWAGENGKKIEKIRRAI